jgi:hypothetical protein
LAGARYTGAGGARKRAISNRMSANICRHRDLGQLERDVSAVADDLGADLDQLLAQAGQRPRFHHPTFCGHCGQVRRSLFE